MTKHTQEATPEQVSYSCDRCGAKDIDVDAEIETMDRDFQGGVVYSQHWHLCQRCRGDFAKWMTGRIDIVFDGPPSPQGECSAPHFVEVEDNETGRSVRFGQWVERDDGYWVLRVTVPDEAKV